MKSMLIISRRAPWAGLWAREALDVALAGGAFDLPLAMLFIDDGVFQLQALQQPAVIQRKDLVANLQALPVFGVTELYACRSSLEARGLTLDGPLAVTVLDAPALAELIARHDQMMTI